MVREMLHGAVIRKHVNFLLRLSVLICCVSSVQAATITVNSLDDDVFVSSSGATFSDTALSSATVPTKCTLRMAIAAANLDLAVGGAGGCAAGNSSTVPGGIASGIPDTINFSVGLAGTINLNSASKMSEAPAIFRAGMGSISPIPGDPAPNTTSTLVVSRSLEIVGNVDGAGLPSIALDGGLLASPTVNSRLLLASDGDATTDMPISIINLKFQNGRVAGSSGGCMFSRESVRLTNVVFDNCVSEGSASGNGYAGALGVFGSRSWTAALPAVGSIEPMARPNVTLINVIVRNSRALKGASTNNSNAGGMAFGSGNATTPGYVGNVYMSNVLVENCLADSSAGFIVRGSPIGPLLSTVEIIDSTIRNNTATGAFDGAVNSPVNAGFVGGFSVRQVKHVEVSRTSVTGNLAGQSIGGAEFRDIDSLTLTDLTAANNTVTPNNTARRASMGGISIDTVRVARAFRLTLEGNVLNTAPAATGSGFAGGAYIAGSLGSIEIHDSIVRNNSSVNGTTAGLYISTNASVLLNRVKLTGNTTTKTGTQFSGYPALETANNGAFKLVSSEISGNSGAQFAVVRLAGSYRDNNGANPRVAAAPLPLLTNTVEIIDSAIHGNTSLDAMLYLETPGVYSVSNSTIANNSVTAGCGGGIRADAYNPFSATNAFQLSVKNTTIARNTVSSCQTALGIGSYDQYNPSTPAAFNGQVTVESSILGSDVATGSVKDAVWIADPSKMALTKSIIEDGGGPVNVQCGTNGNLCNTNAKLDVLGSNGGPTKTMRLLPGSPAIDAGSNPGALVFDQRGATRVVGAAADIGALEASVAVNCSLDMDGVGGVQANKEGLILVRSMMGFSDAAAVAGTGVTQAQWAATKANLNVNCGTSFAP